MVAIRIEFDDEQYERLKELKKHRGLTWSVGFTPAVHGGTLSLIQVGTR